MNETQPDLSAQIKKISDHLVFLEKKLDTLLEQTKEKRPFSPKFGGNRDFQRPRNGFGRPGERPQYPPRRHPTHGHNSHPGKYFSNKPAR